ncbi:hypothetical protein SAMN05518800_6992 [Variovorax sp. YR752]|nr:hypothetical protein SAMN05518800_6992 [Variovorax sp. YR752]
MQKTTWTLLAVIVADAAGGEAPRLVQHQTVEPVHAAAQQSPFPSAPASRVTDGDWIRCRPEGIRRTQDPRPNPASLVNAH